MPLPVTLSRLETPQDKGSTDLALRTVSLTMERDLEDLVAMVRQHPEGLSLGGLKTLFHQAYNRNLSPSALGYNSMANMVDNMAELTIIEGFNGNKKVFHKAHNPPVTMETKDRGIVVENIINMLMKHPNGYGLQTLPTVYRQKYKTELSLKTLGFTTVEALVKSLSEHLIVRENRVFHVMHGTPRDSANPESSGCEVGASATQPQGGLPAAALSFLGPSLITPATTFNTPGPPAGAPSTAPGQAERLTQNNLLQRVMEVMKKYNLDNPPMNRLQSCYREHFGSELPFNEYLSLYDDWEGSQRRPTATTAPDTGEAAPQGHTAFLTKTKDLKDLVKMVRKYPEGLPLAKLAMFFQKTYQRSLSLRAMGFSSMESLVASQDALLTRGTEVFHKSTAISDVPSNTAQTSKEKETMLENLINMLKEHPKGVRLKTLATNYSQTYSKKLCLTTLGFATVELVVCSLPEHLFINGNKVFHVMYRRQGSESEPPAAISWWPPRLSTPSQPVEAPSAAVEPAHKPTAAWQSPTASNSSTSALLPDPDFPVLGAPVPTAKATSSNVLVDGYHRRLRKVHGADMRAMEALEADMGGGVARKWSQSLHPDKINDLMQDVIRDIASQGEHVTREKVISRGCQLLQIPSLESARVKHWQIPALKDLQYIIREVNMFLQAAEYAYSICTLYELSQSLAALKSKKHFEELNLGPLCQLPLVHRMFKVHANTKDDDIPHIETVDVLRQLRSFMRKSPPGVKVNLADFMKHLSDHYKCESPYELGIRIVSVGLPISTLSKVTRSEQALQEKAREQIQKELEEETLERLRKVKKSVLEALPRAAAFSSFTANAELRSRYASLTAAEVVLAVFSNAEGVFSPRMTKHVQAFLLQVSEDRLARALFQLSICGGSLAAPQDLVLKDKSSKAKEQAEEKPSAPLPTEAAVKQFVKDSLSSQTSLITLSHMAALEKKLTKHFHLNNFLSLEMGSFLDFLTKHIQLLQECLGSALVLSSSSLGLGGSGLKPTRQDVFEFIKQCGDVDRNDPEELSLIDSALRAHYRLRDCRDLGFGSLHRLATLVHQQKQLSGGGLSPVHYEAALLARQDGSCVTAEGESVGRLGEMNKEQALSSLLSCPLLEDMGQWSQWDLVFKPLFGSLKDFMESNAGTTGLSAVEVTPGVLLRTTSHTGDQAFCAAAESLDPVGTAGHLVSMVLAYGLTNAPLALLANHMESSLAAAVAKQDLSQAHEDVACYRTVADFLLGCLVRIPVRTCLALMQQVFLEPFAKVLGQTRSKEVLMKAAQSNPQHMNCLHRLGILLGITDWIKDYHRKLRPPQQPQENHVSRASAAQAKPNDVHSESSSELYMSDNEDPDISDSSFPSPALNLPQGSGETKLPNAVNGEEDVRVEEEEEDDEELYELASVPSSEAPEPGSDSKEEEEEEEEEEEAPVTEDRPPVCSQQALIDDIRKSEFGVGVELAAEGQKLMQVHQERLGRSLDRLSTELYSKDTHFVLELIQNADDNSYASEDSITPALAFVVERDCITVLNNEMGFQEKNIRAICDVGRSTKGKHTYGYIGQKGIGFKSVFKVTDCPEIHSNGFHLRFDKNCGPMGYILPHWAPEQRAVDPQLQGLSQHSWTTQISLPLRSESHQTRNLFHDVHPSLLLFLHRLRSIAIYNQLENRYVTMSRKDLSHNILEVEHTDGTERWLVIKSMLKPPKIKDGVECTELALAFQLSTEETGSDVITQPQKQPVFAYLPLRTFGFRFIIQGDFDIPSSREDVDRDSSWNQWLRSEIPLLFLKAMEVFNNHPDFQGLGGLCHFLQFTPLPDEILDFFKPVALQIIQLLKGRACLPTLGSDGAVVYKLPSQVAVCQDPVIREVIGGEELEKHLCLSYLHPALRPAPPPSLLRELGVRYLRGTDVTTVTSAMARELIKMEGIHSEGGVRKLAKLLVCNFRALEHGYGEADSILQTLRDLPIIPLSDGRVVALSGEGVFFPMEEASSKKKKASAQRTGPLSALYQDVCVVQPSLLNCMDPLESQQVRELLRRLGVHELEPEELLQQHIYPAIHSGRWKSKPEAVVVSYLVFIKQHSSSSSLLELSDTAVPVLTSRGLLCPKQSRVYFTEEYGNISLTSQLPGYDWVLLSPSYVKADTDVAGWRELFTKLGVRDGFIIRKERKTLTAKELASSPWSVECSRWTQSSSEDCVIDDYPCEEFYSLATAQLSAPLLLQQRLTLLELLVSNWDSGHRYSQYLTAQVIDSDGRVIKSTNSSFYYHLCRLEWVPAQRPLQSGQEERSFMCPSSVYLSSEEIRGLLGTHVWYVDLHPSEFSRKLGMRETVTVDSLITEHLKKWSMGAQAEDQESESEGAEFTSTVEHIHTVYSYLNKNCSLSGLKELFQHTPAVFVLQQRHGEEWVTGRFYHLKEVCWSDPTSMFLRYKSLTQSSSSPVQNPRVLAPFYTSLEGMKDFFTRLLNVDWSPNIKQYVGLLEVVCSSSPPSSELLQDVSVLYATLAHKCKTEVTQDYDDRTQPRLNHAYCSTLKGMVSDLRVFPTKDNTWVSLSRKPMICDSRELEKVFRPHKDVCLLNLPPAEKRSALKKGRSTKPGQSVDRPAFEEEERDLFLEICGVKRLSACVQSEAQTENLRPCVSMQEMVRSVVPYIQRFLYHREDMSELYPELEESDIAERVKKLSFRQVGKLYRRYQLDVPDRDSIIEMEDVICLLKDQKELYIQKDHLGAKLDICRELVKLFCSEASQRKELMHFLSGLITSLSEPAALKRYLQKEDIKELPEEEERWEVLEPPKPPQPDPSLDRAFSRPSLTEEPPRPPQEGGEQTLVCWPPRASINNTGAPRKTGDGSVVEAVNKMWPPPAPPKDRVYEPGLEPRERSPLVTPNPNPSSRQETQARGGEPNIQRVHSQHPPAPTTPTGSQPSEPSNDRAQPWRESGDQTPGAPKPPSTPEHTAAPAPSAQPSESSNPLTATDPPQAAERPPLGPDAVLVSGMFQGTAAVDAPRPPLIMDFPQWTKDQFMEDMAIACQKPSTVVLSDQRDLSEIGEWGERLVHSFLLHWRDGSAPGRPSVVEWCNESGESGQPYDFKLTFSPDNGAVYVEVKSTVKAEKAFIHMSANELDFALKKKEHYHIFRVYCAGDAQNVRLCRIQNLAQHLHTKNLDLFIFV